MSMTVGNEFEVIHYQRCYLLTKEIVLITMYEMPNAVSIFKEGKNREQEMECVTRQQEKKEETRGSY